MRDFNILERYLFEIIIVTMDGLGKIPENRENSNFAIKLAF